MKRLGKKLVQRLFFLAFLAALLWCFMFAAFIQDVNSQNPSNEPGDGLVVLTGGPGRLDEGFRLLAEGRGARLLLSGINRDLDLETILRDIGQDSNLKDCCVDAENISTNTWSNVREVMTWAKERGFKKVILITSDFHMPRTLVIFREYQGDVEIIPHPIPSQINPLALAIEFNKYLLSLARARLTA